MSMETLEVATNKVAGKVVQAISRDKETTIMARETITLARATITLVRATDNLVLSLVGVDKARPGTSSDRAADRSTMAGSQCKGRSICLPTN